MTAAVTAEDLQIRFRLRGQGTLRAVDGVSMAVQPRETLGIIGESGSGKSTLGRALVGTTAPTAGRVLHDGKDLAALRGAARRAHRRDYQLVYQDPNAALDPRMSVLQSVREPLDIAKLGARADRERKALALLDRMGLTAEQAGRYPHELSGGQKQRVNIARALTVSPRFIVCDEMVAALDVSIQADILNLFAELRQEFGLTTLFITHDIGVVTHVSDRIGVMYLGRLMELGAASAVTSQALHPYTRALLSAEPEFVPAQAGRTRRRVTLQGEIPSPLHPPSGCRFRTRCPLAAERCATEEPAWREARAGHFVACHFALNQEDAQREAIS
ncbi:ABC transporter ATP-binding protein [Acidisphaera sp. L21]|uniref:ABC transporter ATP-binding protein n=1 Tax=Acidisphaera sp. L21 TaxID=1641851 RepID=UPI00131D6067|nr:oligopeptide/dipeptide ABC transporter ATP-binding protein [Acidisphaera sp. L21]